MALNATLYSCEIKLSDSDRDLYQTLAFRIAQHPSESEAHLVCRMLTYCLEYREGLGFSKGGLSDPDTPALAVHDLTGALLRWIEIGLPEPARLHRANKAAPSVAVYSHKEVDKWLPRLAAEKVHRAGDIQVFTFDPQMIASLAARLARRMTFDLVVAEGQLYVTLGGETIVGSVVQHRVTDPA